MPRIEFKGGGKFEFIPQKNPPNETLFLPVSAFYIFQPKGRKEKKDQHPRHDSEFHVCI